MNFREITQTVLAASPASETEVVVFEHHESLTRFANNTIHQNVAEQNTQVTVRAVVGSRVGIVISNDIRPDRLRQLARRAADVARLQPENPQFPGLPHPENFCSKSIFDRATATCSPAERAARVGTICRKAAEGGHTAAGSFTTASMRLGVANSKGILAETETTVADCSTVIMGANSSGWAQSSSCRLTEIDTERMANEAIRKVRLGADPVVVNPGEYTVILDPYAAADLLEMLALDGMGAMAVQEGRSWINGRIGEKVMADLVTIVDDGLDPSGCPMPFDFEGTPKQRVPIVEAGVVKGPVYDTFTASREPGKRSTGHATPPSPSERYGPLPMNLFLRSGSLTIEEMIQSTKQGLYITRFWYSRTVHPRDAVVTGMTRDGTLWVRNGEIVHGAKSLRFTQSYVEALRDAEGMGVAPHLLRSGLGFVSVPPIKIGKFRFTS